MAKAIATKLKSKTASAAAYVLASASKTISTKATKVFKVVLLVLLQSCLTLSLSGCGISKEDINVFRDRGEDYKSARMHPSIIIPEDVHAEPYTDLYEIPFQ